ncbi:MAG: selenocysteine-specific translation elongation factor [Acidobacteria bacterium]|nr:selenocysteine-specific translation elongation factor [Acidobacteriota bacterium]
MTRFIVGTAGHIDHGKSTLVRALTGIDPDRLKEEQARGISIELGFAHADIGGHQVAFVDVPGHERFVRTMLAGVGGVDFVMLVVAADESVMPQTREHFDICRLLGVGAGCVVITRADLADDDTRALVALEVADLVHGSFLEGQPVVTVSARTGEGLETLQAVLVQAAAQMEPRAADGRVRLPIDRVFTVHGFGTVVTGTLLSGTVHVGDELEVAPGAARVRVRGLQVHGQSVDLAAAGQRTAVNVTGDQLDAVARGRSLMSPGVWLASRRVDVALEVLPDAPRLMHGSRLHVHHGTTEVLGRVTLAGEDQRDVAPGSRALARLRLDAPLVVSRGDRLILRSYSPMVTIGAATVIDPWPRAIGVRTSRGTQRLEQLAAVAGADLIASLVREADLTGLSREHLVARTGVTPPMVAAQTAALGSAGTVQTVGDRVIAVEALTRGRARLVEAVKAFHVASPMSEGMPREALRVLVMPTAPPAVFDHLMAMLSGSGVLVDRDRVALREFRVAIPGGEEGLRRLEDAYAAAGLTPPDTASVAASLAMAATGVEAAVAYLLRQKRLVKVEPLVVHPSALERLKADLAELKGKTPGGRVTIDVAYVKDRYGITRKFAIPLLEYLDRERITRRMGEHRVLL